MKLIQYIFSIIANVRVLDVVKLKKNYCLITHDQMKNIVLLLIAVFPFFIHAEYNGVHVKFKIELINGDQSIGYKYVAHGLNNSEFKHKLESEPKSFLMNQLTYEPGEYGYYTERLEYPYGQSVLYKLIEPVELNVVGIKKVEILDLITASYAIQITGDFNSNDQSWMRSIPIAKYSDFEEMCTYDIFIHSTNSISAELKKELERIIEGAEAEIKEKDAELNHEEEKDVFNEEMTRAIYSVRNAKIDELIKNNKQLKTIVISMCTC